jgi:flagellin
MRNLAAEAASDINSQSDRNNLQAEISQLILEVNRISQNTNFNGQPLLDGSHSGFQPAVDASFNIISNSVLAGTGNLVSSATVGAGWATTAATTGGAGSGADGTIEVQVVNTGTNTVTAVLSFFDSTTGQVTQSTTAAAGSSTATLDGVTVTLGSFTASDAGTTAFIKVSQFVASQSSAAGALTIQSGANEGDTVQIGIQATNAQTLRISNINVAATAGNIAAEDAIGQIDNALDTLLNQRAQLGAVIVRLNEDANNDSVAAVNLQASESSIRDLNVGQATTEFTKLQVLVQVGTSVLAQANANAQSVLGLFR